MKTTLKYFRNYRVQSVLSPVFKLSEACFELTVPIIVARIIDTGINAGNSDYIAKHVVILGLFAVTGYISAILAQYFAAYSACGISSDIRAELFRKVEDLSVTDYEKLGASGIITSLTSDVNQISSGINLFLRLLLRSPFIVIGATVMAFTVSPTLALIFVVTVAALSIIVALNMKRAVPLYSKTRTGLDRLVSAAHNGLAGVRVIRSYNRSEDDAKHFRDESESLCGNQINAAFLSGWLNPITFAVVNLAICALIYSGAINVSSGSLTQGQVVALYNYMSQILIELIKLANLIVSVSRAIACADRVESILAIEPERHSDAKTLDSAKAAHSVSFRDVSFTYQGNSESSLSNISFDIAEGERFGIIGSTGSGKSTVASLIAGLYHADSGMIAIDGVPVDGISRKSITGCVGYSFQKTRIFSGSIGDNISLGRSNINVCDIDDAVRMSCTDDVIRGKSEGLGYKVESNGSGLSGGQKQRIGIARAVAGRPGILILDDSTSALDSVTEHRLLGNLLNSGYKPTVIVISQKIGTVSICDRIVLMDDGRIDCIGTHEQLLRESEKYRYLCSLQKRSEVPDV